jgi:N-acetylneuraminic acid mutarotase
MRSPLLFLSLLPFRILLFIIEFTRRPNRTLRGSYKGVEPKGTWEKKAPLPSYRYECSAAALDGKLYVIGGVKVPSVWFPTRLVESYDLKTNTWKRVASYPKLVHHSAAVSVSGKVYVVGGNGIRIIPRSDMYAYDPAKNVWIRCAHMPTARGALGAGVIDGKIYAVGGGINGSPVGTLEVYDPNTDAWETKASMPTKREHITATVAGGKLYVLGGYAGTRFDNVTTHEVYDPILDTWTSRAPLPYEVSGLASATIGDSIFIFGGEQGWAVSAEVHEYKISEDRWVRRSDLPVGRYALTATEIDGHVHTIGGSGYLMGDDFRDEHEVFTP